jgi:para-aminobenzoate synthetase component 1
MIFQQALPYHKLYERYTSLLDLQGCVLIRSHPKSRGRFDIFSALPISECQALDCDDWMMQWPLKASSTPWPFVGGVIGWVSYEAGLEWHGLPQAPQKLIQHLPPLHLRYYPGAIVVDHHEQSAYLVWHDAASPFWQKQLLEAWHSPQENPALKPMEPCFKPLIHKKDYLENIGRIQQDIQRGRVYQVNYTQAFLAELEDHPWHWYWQTQSQNPVHYSGYWAGDNYQIMSFSPECFIQIQEQTAVTQPIKGTIGRGDTPAQDQQHQIWLEQSEKNRAENVMIVDLLRNDFGKHAIPGTVTVPFYCQRQTYKNVHHLVSEVRCQIPQHIHPWTFLKSCMPGGSITGAPKHEAMKVISELEPYQRQAYCGNLFYLSRHGQVDSNIMIRTAIYQQQQLVIAAGGGIVIDSNAEEEYQECLAKIKTIAKHLAV